MVQCLSRTLNCYECGYCTINEYKLVLIMNTKKSISYEHIIYIWGYIYIYTFIFCESNYFSVETLTNFWNPIIYHLKLVTLVSVPVIRKEKRASNSSSEMNAMHILKSL